jgi:hypothetical protein
MGSGRPLYDATAAARILKRGAQSYSFNGFQTFALRGRLEVSRM